MAEFVRKNSLFSLCGLNCGLCTMKIGGYCPGCGQGNKPCKVARCGMEHGIEYCFECSEYPCGDYEHADDYDSFITHRNQKSDMEKAKDMGIEAYSAEQAEKLKLLEILLSEYNSGREKTLFCLAVNLLAVEDITRVLEESRRLSDELSQKERAAFVSGRLREAAKEKKIELKLRKK
ncbi:MAG: DUF3795 domain-containing protein [Eubacteriales bacterium]|nr:DUF3795 domain-containing protein [Eubacteriales bacterium]